MTMTLQQTLQQRLSMLLNDPDMVTDTPNRGLPTRGQIISSWQSAIWRIRKLSSNHSQCKLLQLLQLLQCIMNYRNVKSKMLPAKYHLKQMPPLACLPPPCFTVVSHPCILLHRIKKLSVQVSTCVAHTLVTQMGCCRPKHPTSVTQRSYSKMVCHPNLHKRSPHPRI